MENKTKKPKSTKYWLDIVGDVASTLTFLVVSTGAVVIAKKTHDMGLWGNKKETPAPAKKENDGFEEVI